MRDIIQLDISRRYAATTGVVAVEYGDEVVVFNDATWETHILNPAAAAVLALIAEAPRAIEEIATALASWLEPDESPEAMLHAERSVAVLAELRLVTPLDDEPR